MYFNSIAFAAICTMFAVAIAQVAVPWWSSLPACGVKCANLAAANASCNVSDLKCLCNSTTFLNIFEACVGATCPIPVNTSDPVSVFSKDCKSIDWTWGFSPCIRNCALKSATAIGCDINDKACICANYSAFLDIFIACIKNNCPAQLNDAIAALDSSLVPPCPVVDPPAP